MGPSSKTNRKPTGYPNCHEDLYAEHDASGYNHRTTSLIEDMQITKTNNNGTSPFLGPLPLQDIFFFRVKSPARLLYFFFLGGGGRYSTVAILISRSPQSGCVEQASNKYFLTYTQSFCFTVKIVVWGET